MDFGDKALHTETYGLWEMHFHEVTAPDGSYLCSYVELQLESARKCRLSVVRPELERQAAISLLRARAIDWIDAWHRRDHTGNTGFADL